MWFRILMWYVVVGAAMVPAATNGLSPSYWFSLAVRETEDIRKPADRCDALVMIAGSQLGAHDQDGFRKTAKLCQTAAEELDGVERVRTLGDMVPIVYSSGGTQEAHRALAQLCDQALVLPGGDKQDALLASLGMLALRVEAVDIALRLIDKLESPQRQADLCVTMLERIRNSSNEVSAAEFIRKTNELLESAKWKDVRRMVEQRLAAAMGRYTNAEPAVAEVKKPRKELRDNEAVQAFDEALRKARLALENGDKKALATCIEAVDTCYRALDKTTAGRVTPQLLRFNCDIGNIARAKQLLGWIEGAGPRADALLAIAAAQVRTGDKAQAKISVNAAAGEMKSLMRDAKNGAGEGGRFLGPVAGMWLQVGEWQEAVRLAELSAAAPQRCDLYRQIGARLIAAGDVSSVRALVNQVREPLPRIAALCGAGEGSARTTR